MSRACLLTALAVILLGVMDQPGIASEAVDEASPQRQALKAEVSDRELFEMCCWAKGRAGFNHCEEYGVCVDHPEKRCVGRGPAEGMTLACGSPSANSRGDGEGLRPTTHGDFFLLARR